MKSRIGAADSVYTVNFTGTKGDEKERKFPAQKSLTSLFKIELGKASQVDYFKQKV